VTLDERLAVAAETLRRSVRREPPPFEQIRRRARRRRAVGAGLVTAIVVVAGAYALAPFGGSGDGSVVSAGPGPEKTTGAACVPVVAHDSRTQAGCELATDVGGGGARIEELTARYGGIPVYRDGSGRTQVGVVTPDLGFVPLVLVPQLAELRACWPAVEAMLADPADAPLDAGCRELVGAMGYPESFFEGRRFGP
jgi:hypothetical protein